ncbi:hypothetical protein HK405_014455, partial [Cladochytrium tenue]
MEVGLPGPAQYSTAHAPQYSRFLAQAPTSSFRPPVAAVSTAPSEACGGSGGCGPSATPGPAAYDADRALRAVMRSHAAAAGASYVFKS